jgi:hypothetical protein
MSNHHHELADQVVAAFRTHLEGAEQKNIGEAHFRELHRLVCEALSVERQEIVDRVQGLAQELRREVEKPALEL